jgi:hypothetical protein
VDVGLGKMQFFCFLFGLQRNDTLTAWHCRMAHSAHVPRISLQMAKLPGGSAAAWRC